MLLLELQARPVISVECAQKHSEMEHEFPEGRDRNDRLLLPSAQPYSNTYCLKLWHRLALSLFEHKTNRLPMKFESRYAIPSMNVALWIAPEDP